jgi:hypothetical protein
MSVLVPNQPITTPAASRTGWIRVRKGRKTPSAPRSGKTISKRSPVAIDLRQRSSTSGSRSGSCTDVQPQPSISSGVVPVYSYQRWLYQLMCPSAPALQHRVGIESANVRSRRSLSCSSSSRLRASYCRRRPRSADSARLISVVG